MKKLISASLISLTLLQSGCATIFGGSMTACQKHKPAKGEPTRAIRGVALTFDIVLGLFVFEIPTGVDFLTGAVYKPCQYTNANPPPTQSPVSSPAISNTQSGPITTFKVETKLAPSGPYDSLKNFVGSNVQQYVGQELYLNGVSEQLRQYGYRGFIKNYKRDYELNAGNVYKSDKDGYTSSYDAMVGKYFTVLDVIKKPDAANDINNGKIFFLKLQEKQSGDLLYFVYDTSYDFQFPFIVTGYMTKLKERYIGKEYNIGGQHLKCIDVAIEEKYYTVNAILQNNKGEKIPHSIEGLSAYQSNDTAIYNKVPSTANNTKRINFDSINSSYLPEHSKKINFDSINSSNFQSSRVDSNNKGTVGYLDYKYGFRDAKFEMPFSSFKNMVLIENDGRIKYYHRASDRMTIGEYKLSEITYCFYRDKLMSITLNTKGLVNSRGLLEMLQDLYGSGMKDNEYIERYFWDGAYVNCMYEENSITNDAHVWFDCPKLEEQNKAEEKQNQQKTEKEF